MELCVVFARPNDDRSVSAGSIHDGFDPAAPGNLQSVRDLREPNRCPPSIVKWTVGVDPSFSEAFCSKLVHSRHTSLRL